MKATCRKIRLTLVSQGPVAFRDDEAGRRHLVDCKACFAFAEAIVHLDKGLSVIPPIDAPDSLVEDLLRSPELSSPPPEEVAPDLPQRQLRFVGAILRQAPPAISRAAAFARRNRFATAAAATFLIALSLGLLVHVADKSAVMPAMKHTAPSYALSHSAPAGRAVGDKVAAIEKLKAEVKDLDALDEKTGERKQLVMEDREREGAEQEMDAVEGGVRGGEDRGIVGGIVGGSVRGVPLSTGRAAEKPGSSIPVSPPKSYEIGIEVRAHEDVVQTEKTQISRVLNNEFAVKGLKEKELFGRDALSSRNVPAESPPIDMSTELPTAYPAADAPTVSSIDDLAGFGEGRTSRLGGGKGRYKSSSRKAVQGRLGSTTTDLSSSEKASRRLYERSPAKRDLAAVGSLKGDDRAPKTKNKRRRWNLAPKKQPEEQRQAESESVSIGDSRLKDRADKQRQLEANAPSTDTAALFLAERASLEGATFIDPRGYFQNNYVPGDRELRRLHASLASRKSEAMGSPHTASHEPAEPFDPPRDAALALYLHADQRGISGPTRLLLEVGLQGTRRRSGHRPPLNLGIVLDLRNTVSTDVMAAMRALADALAASRDLGDSFSLVVAGRPGGEIVAPIDFRHGPVTVALDQLFEEEQATSGLTLPQALATAVKHVGETDDPTAPLGSSSVLIVTSQSFGSDLSLLERMASRSAIAGIPVSAAGIGKGINLGEIDRLVLAGQGNRRLLERPAEAADLVERELAAVGRVIARAVRLRIRLAPGIKLISVIGSHRLDKRRAQRVRDQENSIDLRLSRNLGIRTDRGVDEEGIQIVIPAFYSGDGHTILLDLVAPGPGPIADVTARFKDLVFMKNGLTRTNLSLARDDRPAGPLETSVLASYLAHRLSETLQEAGDSLGSGRRDTALAKIEWFRMLLSELRTLRPALAKDPDLQDDLTLLATYIDILQNHRDSTSAYRRYLADSLRYAGRLKTSPRPAVEGP